ncbi:MarR family winged helix-turn-helix transcriptional regulator [Streptosporangium sp. NPDC050855]|uniref:MarR family winged helix-turn-helix transcriptional regulator n=1 Tax=Streptosporangium sp. NPDC050855 TaxID=3366194 RepID=UPI00379B0D9C
MRNPHDRRTRSGSPAPGKAGPALFALIRHWSRRWPQQIAGNGAESGHVSRVVVVDIIGGTGDIGDIAGDVGGDAGTGGVDATGGGGRAGQADESGRADERGRADESGQGDEGERAGGSGRSDRVARVGVRDVAEALGVDRSVASRMVADAVAAGLVRRGTLEGDARHADLVLTASGRELLAAARRWQDEAFDTFTEDWSAEEREIFATLLVRFVARATATTR